MSRPHLRPILCAAAPALLLAGCAVGPNYKPPQTAAVEAARQDWVEAGEAGPVDREWWTRFDDPAMTALVEKAMADAPDVREAEARLAEARAQRDAIFGGRFPAVQATGSAMKDTLSENGQLPLKQFAGFDRKFNLFDIGFDASWEIDFWGRRTRQLQGAKARVEAAEYGKREVLLNLAAETARAYIETRAAQAALDTAQSTADAAAELSRLTGLRFAAGDASQVDANRADTDARDAAAALAVARAALAANRYRLGMLAGVAPEQVDGLLGEQRPVPSAPATILTGVRSELLERRPDIRIAERQLAAATADIGVATADLFPRFSLAGSFGQQARTTGDLFSSDSFRMGVGPQFSWPIFAGGTLRAQLRAADARGQAAAARYDKAVLGALADSETAINRFLNTGHSLEQAETALAKEQDTLRLVQLMLSHGEVDRLALALARIAANQAETNARDARAAHASAAVALYKAL
ncbi:MAG: efflux transporter outer membrane subunit, partial [Novosphingobium sp.]|nr:efflux transporter outer membrane subunit [Novosphingobium sp.]